VKIGHLQREFPDVRLRELAHVCTDPACYPSVYKRELIVDWPLIELAFIEMVDSKLETLSGDLVMARRVLPALKFDFSGATRINPFLSISRGLPYIPLLATHFCLSRDLATHGPLGRPNKGLSSMMLGLIR
jgi:hypothetical protein